MADVPIVSSVSDIQNFIGEIQRLPVSNAIRVELIECLQSITVVDVNCLHQTGGSSLTSRFNEAIILLNKFAKVTVDALEACELLPFPIGIICKAITAVVGIFFSKDVASAVISRFSAILEADLIAKCRATCTKLVHCISYMQGLPATSQLQQEQRSLHLQLVASDVPMQTGLDEVLFLGEKIRDMVTAANIKETDELFQHAQLYCCLATFRELFLLYRFAIQSTFSVDACSIRNVLDAQKTNDKEILKFLYKPTTKTVRLFRCCFLDQWPILRCFLHRRDLYPENLSGLNGTKVKIKSVRNGCKPLHPAIFPLFKEDLLFLRGDTNSNGNHLELRGGINNVFTIWSHCYNPPRQVYCDKILNMSISEGEPSPSSSKWYLLKLLPETQGETECYMIWLVSDHQKCVYAVWNNNVGLTSTSKPENSFFWKLENVS